ncbi:uncharacterized protein V6R79_017448 [Siganus canaliculatus]
MMSKILPGDGREKGNLQVFYQDLPLSIQDGYENFLSSSTTSLQQYQVFGHLKRLGYVVHRFDPSLEPSPYARQLNLPQSRDKAARQLKRKRSASPSPGSSHTEVQDAATADIMEEDKSSNEGKKDEKLPESPLTSSPSVSESQTSVASLPDSSGGRTWWRADVPKDDLDHQPASSAKRWHFSSIPFPDLGSREHLSRCLPAPDSSLLPGSLAVGVCDVALWRHKINLREVKMSAKERERERRHRHNINRDKEVLRCRNWTEYHKLLARRQGQREGRPAHLWNREVTPLHDPKQPVPTAELLDRISVTKSTHLLDGASSLKALDEWKISFNVYQPDTVADFKKSSPGKPYSRMCVCSFDGPVPDLQAVKLLAFQSGDIPVVFAVVDHGDISFYTFKDFHLPTDVYP